MSRSTSDDDETIRRMDADGATILDIATATGLPPSVVQWRRRAVLGLPARPRGARKAKEPRTRVDLAKARDVLAGGGTMTDAAKAVGVTRQGLARLLERWGVSEDGAARAP